MSAKALILVVMASILSPHVSALETIEGPWVKRRSYDYRYVTTYETKAVVRPLPQYPWIEEDCHDFGNRFANWSQTHAYEIVYGGSLNFSLLGLELSLGADRSKTVEFAFQRWVTPTEGIRARHTLNEVYETWEGETRVEYRYGDVVEPGDKAYPFKLEKMNYGLVVKREILEKCE